jgi:hypothetical protein
MERKRAEQEIKRAELDRQVADREERKRAVQESSRRRDVKLTEEALSYDPWGRPGCGAPLRAADGGVISNLQDNVGAYNMHMGGGGNASGNAIAEGREQQPQALHVGYG